MLLVHAVGAVTPVGLDAVQTCAALRAALSGVEARIAQAPPNDPLLAAEVPARVELKRRPDCWLVHLAVRALRECLADYEGDVSRLAFVLSVPEIFRAHPAITDETGQALASRIVGAVGLRFSHFSRVLTMGNAATAFGLRLVDELLARGDIDGAIVGGVDSLLVDADLDRLRDSGRLYLPGHPFGVIPGEGAALFLVGSSFRPLGIRPLAAIRGIGLAEEADSALSTRYSVGIAMKTALDEALISAGEREGAIGWRITDINGERYRTWESSALLARYYRTWRDGLPCMHLPGATGDLGAATQALQVVFGAVAMKFGFAPAALAVCEAGSEGGLRGACVIGPAPGEISPPFRASIGVLSCKGPGRAFIARLADRLPHELSFLMEYRGALMKRPIRLQELALHDERIDALQSVLRSYGRAAWRLICDAVEQGDPDACFAKALMALDLGRRDDIFEVVHQARDLKVERSMLRAFGWTSPRLLKGVVLDLAKSSDSYHRLIAANCLGLHRVAGGGLTSDMLADSDDRVRARALRLIGETGDRTHVSDVARALIDQVDEVRFWAARSAFLLGQGSEITEMLIPVALRGDRHSAQTLSLLVQGMELNRTRDLLHRLASDAADNPLSRRQLVVGCGMAGDPGYLNWIIGLMADTSLCRIAGEAFSLITGADLESLGLVCARPGEAGSGPSDNPEEEDLAVDHDDGLPWPHHLKVKEWWTANSHRFQPGVRYFMGAPPSWAHCLQVLKDGYQRQRIAAAHHLCLLQPGTPLFNCAAPAWRQKRLLERMD